MTITIQPSFAKGEVAPDVYGRVDIAAYSVALKQARNVRIRITGGAENRPGSRFVGPVKDHTYAPRLIDFEFKTQDTYMIEMGDQYMRFITDGSYVTEDPMFITGYTQANPVVVSTFGPHGYSNGDEVFISDIVDVEGESDLNQQRYVIQNVTSTTYELTDQVDGTSINGTGLPAYAIGGFSAKIYEISTPYAIADVPIIKHVQTADIMTLVHPLYPVYDLKRFAPTDWRLELAVFEPQIDPPTTITVSPNNSGSETYEYQVTAIDEDSLEESLPTSGSTASGGSTPDNTITWPAVTGAGRYAVYRRENGLYGWVGETTDLTITDVNIEPDMSLSPPNARNPFENPGDYPGAVSFFEQRKVFGGSLNKPDTTFYSQTGNTSNFSRSEPLQQDDSIEATLNSRKVNEIRHFVPGNDLAIFTSGSEWRVNAGSDSAFAFDTIRQKPQSYWGASHLEPVVFGQTVLFAEHNSFAIRSFSYSLQSDSYVGDDVNLLAPHIFRDYKIVDMNSAQSPFPVVYCVREDGKIAVLSFNEQQEVLAWAVWDTDGDYESVGVMSGDRPNHIYDEVYTVVKREVNGNTVRYVELFDDRRFQTVEEAFFVDSGLTYEGAPTNSVTGLWHLEGEEAVAVADGDMYFSTVVDGTITLPNAVEASIIHVGKVYQAYIETLPIEAPRGTIQGRLKNIPEVTVRVQDTRGMRIGPDLDSLTEWAQRTNELMGDPTRMFTGDVNQKIKSTWRRDGSLFFVQAYPLPWTVLAVIPKVEMQDDN